MDSQQLRNILESCLLVAGKPMSIAQLEVLFDEDIDRPARAEIKEALQLLQQSYEGRGIELVEIASGWRLQSASSMEHWVGRLFQEKQPRYSRALLETLVLIAYRQPITRGEIEEVRGVAVSSNIIRTLQEREWVKEMGYKDVPGKPALWGTTKEFLDYFNLKRLDELPTLAEARDLAEIDAALAAEVGLVDGVADSVAANDSQGEGETDGSSTDPDLTSVVEEETGTEAEAGIETEAGTEAEAGIEAGTEAETETETDTTTLAGAGNVAETTDVVQTDKELTAEVEGVIAEEINVDTDNLDRDVGEVADAGTAHQGEPGFVVPIEAEAADLDGVSTEASKDANQPFLQLADVDIADAVENEDGADLISLAATLGNESSTPDQPDLGEVVEGFDGESNSVDANALEATELEPLADDPSHSEQDDARQVESVEISAHDLDIGEWRAPDSPRQRPNEGDAEPVRAEAEADLRRVIDDFAEEHRQQLDADTQLKSASGSTTQSDVSPASTTGRMDNTVRSEDEPVTTEEDEDGVQRTRLYGISGTVESELNPDDQNDVSDNPSDDHYDEAKGGEP